MKKLSAVSLVLSVLYNAAIVQADDKDPCLLLLVAGCRADTGCKQYSGRLSRILECIENKAEQHTCISTTLPGTPSGSEHAWPERLAELQGRVARAEESIIAMKWSEAKEGLSHAISVLADETIPYGKERISKAWPLMARVLLEQNDMQDKSSVDQDLRRVVEEALTIFPSLVVGLDDYPPKVFNVFKNTRAKMNLSPGLSWVYVAGGSGVDYFSVDGFTWKAGTKVLVRPGRHELVLLERKAKGKDETFEPGVSFNFLVSKSGIVLKFYPVGPKVPALFLAEAGIGGIISTLGAGGALIVDIEKNTIRTYPVESDRRASTGETAKSGFSACIDLQNPPAAASSDGRENPESAPNYGWIWPMAAAGATAVAGAVLGGLALHEKSKLEEMEANDPGAYRQKQAVFERAVSADVCFGTAAALATWGIIWFLLTPSGDSEGGTSITWYSGTNTVGIVGSW